MESDAGRGPPLQGRSDAAEDGGNAAPPDAATDRPRHAGAWISGIVIALAVSAVCVAWLVASKPEKPVIDTSGGPPIADTVATTATAIPAELPPEPGTITGRQAADEALKAGNEAFADGDYATALEQYGSVTRLAPHFASAFVARANTYTAMGDPQRALAEYQAAIDADASDENAFFSRGMLLWMLGRLPESENDLRKAVELDPDDRQAYQRLSRVLYEQEKTSEAADLYATAYKADATRAWALHGWLDWLMAQKAYDDVLSICEAESESPHAIEVALFRGLADSELKRYDDAIPNLEEVIRLDPYELGFLAHEQLYLAYKGSGHPDDCVKELETYAKLLGRVADTNVCRESSP